MGQAALIRRFFVYCVIGFAAGAPALAHAAATAQGVALNAAASCSNANLDITLNTAGATREYGRSTNPAGVTLDEFEQPTPGLGNYNGIYIGYNIKVVPAQPNDTLIGAYAYVGEAVPTPANTAEFYILFNCSTRQVLLACYGPYGTCPKTAQEGIAHFAARNIPTLTDGALALTILVLGAIGGVTVRRRQSQH